MVMSTIAISKDHSPQQLTVAQKLKLCQCKPPATVLTSKAGKPKPLCRLIRLIRHLIKRRKCLLKKSIVILPHKHSLKK